MPRWRPNWASKIHFWEPMLVSIFGGGLGGQEALKLASILDGSWRPMSRSKAIFLRPNMAPCWPHVSPQHEPMLDFQHGAHKFGKCQKNNEFSDLFWLFLKPAWTYFWPTWPCFGSQHGPISEANMDLLSVSRH